MAKSVFQNIQTKTAGLPCAIRVMNHSGDDVLTTYDTALCDSVTVATKDLQDFFQSCIDEYRGKNNMLSPLAGGLPVDAPNGQEFDWIKPEQILAPDFDLSLFREIVIQPHPLAGG